MAHKPGSAENGLVHLQHDYQSLQARCRAFVLHLDRRLEVSADALSVNYPHVAAEKIDIARDDIAKFVKEHLS